MPKRSSWARHCLFLHLHHVFVDFHWYLWGQQQNTQKNLKLQWRVLIGCRNQVPVDFSTTGLDINCSNMKRISFNSAFTQTMEVGVGLSWWDAVKEWREMTYIRILCISVQTFTAWRLKAFCTCSPTQYLHVFKELKLICFHKNKMKPGKGQF